nr:formin-like protein 3 [Aegilops tauschii subsp. strangulata]
MSRGAWHENTQEPRKETLQHRELQEGSTEPPPPEPPPAPPTAVIEESAEALQVRASPPEPSPLLTQAREGEGEGVVAVPPPPASPPLIKPALGGVVPAALPPFPALPRPPGCADSESDSDLDQDPSAKPSDEVSSSGEEQIEIVDLTTSEHQITRPNPGIGGRFWVLVDDEEEEVEDRHPDAAKDPMKTVSSSSLVADVVASSSKILPGERCKDKRSSASRPAAGCKPAALAIKPWKGPLPKMGGRRSTEKRKRK